MTLIQIFFIIFVHWIGDFVFQADWMAKDKSSHSYALIAHTIVYTLIWVLALGFYVMSGSTTVSATGFGLFVLFTFLTHTATDYYTSRTNKQLWEAKDVHNFFVSIGFDQCLHYLQLFICFKYLILTP